VSGDTVPQTINRLNRAAVIEMPSDEIEFDFNDFTQASNQMGIYRSYCLGFIGQGPTKTRFRINPNSSTQVAQVPTQASGASNPLTLMRVGQELIGPQQICANFSLIGTDQPVSVNNEGFPHNYSGLLNYKGTGAIYQNLFIQGCPGNWNAPPGETFQLNDYRGTGNIYRDIEVSGWNEAMTRRVGGSPLGTNGSTNTYIEDCWFHDSFVSSLTFAMAGSATTGTATMNPTVRRVTVERNAMHGSGLPGTGFSVVNLEGVGGNITYAYCNFRLSAAPGDPDPDWASAHVSYSSARETSTLTLDHISWSGGYPPYRGALCVKVPNQYAGVTNLASKTPTVIDYAGRTLQPYPIYGYSSAYINIDITKQYVLNLA
jgi:hypothetical protein